MALALVLVLVPDWLCWSSMREEGSKVLGLGGALLGRRDVNTGWRVGMLRAAKEALSSLLERMASDSMEARERRRCGWVPLARREGSCRGRAGAPGGSRGIAGCRLRVGDGWRQEGKDAQQW